MEGKQIPIKELYFDRNREEAVLIYADGDNPHYPYVIEDLQGKFLTSASKEYLDKNYEKYNLPAGACLMPTIEPLDKYKRVGEKIGALVDEKNKQYGDSFNKSAEFLKILYPNGVPVEHYSDMLGIIRVFDKLMRIANGNQGNENGWNDICGYSILKSAD